MNKLIVSILLLNKLQKKAEKGQVMMKKRVNGKLVIVPATTADLVHIMRLDRPFDPNTMKAILLRDTSPLTGEPRILRFGDPNEI